ncbi:hypothetical protein QOZ80_5AG0397670 [Eleusine coracana subsp. coracana]|nr:hypothetical protein QOZ80_5AG0397670 [Eleusine coracana subsp. coracana]
MAPSPAAPPLLDDIWDDIFRRLDAAEDLARASAVCTSFCRVVRSPRFLRRFRVLHPPHVLGFLDPKLGFCTAVPPHGAAPAGRALAAAADFTFSFVPTPNLWRVRDARDGRVLLSHRSTVDSTALDDLLVCDPLHRRYVQISPISGDLLGSTRRRTVPRFEPFLAPVAVEEEMEKEPSFRVICNVLFKRNVTAFIFSSVTGKWQGAMPFHLDFTPAIRHYVRNCFYWTCYRNKLLVFDPREMKFSVIDLPPHHFKLGQAVVDAGDDRLGLITFGRDDKTLALRSKKWCDSDVGEQEWQHDKEIPLPDCCQWYTILDSAEGLLLLQGVPRDISQSACSSWPEGEQSHYCTLELKTLLIQRLCALDYEVGTAHLYAGFPPLLPLPSV